MVCVLKKPFNLITRGGALMADVVFFDKDALLFTSFGAFCKVSA